MNYPDLEKYAYSFARAELNLSRGGILTAISNVSIAQPTTEGTVMGTRPWPLMVTEGTMSRGSGTVTFSEEGERVKLIDGLGTGYRTAFWTLTWTLTAEGRPTVKITARQCRILDNPIAHGQGDEALGGDVAFSFAYYLVNGKAPHKGMPTT